jgi:glycosyltransferase involved in cell wall biosynthesis
MTDIAQKIKDLKILVVVPTYNNSATIDAVISDVKRYTADILVVDDGSTGEAISVLESLEARKISYSPNKGKGYALRMAISYAVSNGYEYVLTMDADGQHYASDIEKFVDAIELHPGSLIIGARNLKADNMPSKNTFANRFSNFWFMVETGQKLEDTQSGFRLYPLKTIAGMHFFTTRYEFEVEVIVRAAWKGVSVLNIPVNVFYPPAGKRVSHFKPVKDFTRISILNTFLVLAAFLLYYPWRFIKSLNRRNICQFVKDNITHAKHSNNKIAASIGVGVFFGIFPVWGYQMIIAGVTAHFLKLNKVLTLISSNISIPPMIPLILYGSFWAGSVVTGNQVSLSLNTASFESVYKDLLLYFLGAAVLAFVCGFVMYLVSLFLLLIFRRKNNG